MQLLKTYCIDIWFCWWFCCSFWNCAGEKWDVSGGEGGGGGGPPFWSFIWLELPAEWGGAEDLKDLFPSFSILFVEEPPTPKLDLL